MSGILLTWLNTEVDLSRKIKCLEKDFANGYLLGELLHKFNQLTNLAQFRDENHREAKINNFGFLEEVLKNVGVHFNPSTAQDIMNEKPGSITTLLYEIRSTLEKKGVNPETLSLKKSSHFQEMYSPKKIGRKIEQFDKFEHKNFMDNLQKKTRSQKEIDMERKLAKYQKFQEEEEVKFKEKMLQEELERKFQFDAILKEKRNQAQRYHSFLQLFEQKGIQAWKANMLNTKERVKKDLDFQLQEALKIKAWIDNSIRSAEIDAKRKIESFEENVLLNPKKSKKDKEIEENPNMEIAGFSHFNNLSHFETANKFAEAMKTKIFEKIVNDQTTKTERNRRRRKIIVEQSKAQLEIENRRREEQYTSKLFKQSNQEKQLSYEVYRVSQSKSVILENRVLRNEMYDERKEMDTNFLEKNEEEFLKYQRENFKREQEKEEFRRKELEIAMKQKTRSKNSDICKDMVKLIVDIAEEAYVYQQVNDSEEMDPRVWREWSNLFIHNQSVQNKEMLSSENSKENKQIGTMGPPQTPEVLANTQSVMNVNSNYNTNYNNTFYSIFSSDPQSTVLDKTLDECEFFDYVHFIGQWSADLLPSNAFIVLSVQDLAIESILPSLDKADAKLPAGAAKKNVTVKTANATKDPIEDILKDDDPDNLVIPKSTVKNTFFGDIIDILVEMRYEEESNEHDKGRYLFSYIPIKLAIIGQDFSGQKTQAKILSENFPLKIYDFEQLVKTSLDLLTKFDNNKNEDMSYASEDKMTPIMQMRNERAADEAKYAKIKELANATVNVMLNGEAIPDEIYVDLLMEFIKIDFPHKTDEEVLKEILDRMERKEAIYESLEKNNDDRIKRPKTFAKVEQELNQELMKISLEGSKGFIIVNFPSTYNQAKILEKKLSGYIPPYENPKSAATVMKDNYSQILDKNPPILPPEKLIKSGLDLIFYLDVSASECTRRAVGRRVVDLVQGQGQGTDDQKVIYHLDDNPPPTNSNICEKLVKISNPANCESSLVTRHLAFDITIPHIIEFYQPFGFEKYQLKLFQRVNGNQTKDFVTHDLISYVNRLVQFNEDYDKEIYEKNPENSVTGFNINQNILNQKDASSVNERTIEKLNNNIAGEGGENVASVEMDEYSAYKTAHEAIKKALNKDLSEILFKFWNKIFDNYIMECKSIFKFLRVQRVDIGSTYNIICQKFIEFLKRPSKKQIHLLDYQIKYNKFLDDYPDLKDDHQVKEEHHQEVDDLNDRIFEIIEARKNEAIEERKKIMTSGWIENEIEKFYMALERLYQNEIDKFIGSLQIIRDFYHNIDNRPLVELPPTSFDIIKEEVDPTPIEGEVHNDTVSTFPRVEKLYRTALRIQFQYEEALRESERRRLEKIQESQKKAKNEKNPPGGKKAAGAAQQDHLEVKEAYRHEEEMKASIKNEKAKYRYRITLLKYWGTHYLKNFRNMATHVHNKLEDWIILAIKAENEALNQLTAMLKANIENESKIKYELSLETFDLIVNMDVQNYIELPPQPLPPKEVIDHSKFNIVQLSILIEELKTYLIEGSDNIRTSTFIDIFIKKYIASKNDNDVYYGIPELLKKLSFYNYFKFIKHLDPDNTDFMSIKCIGTYFALLNSKVCSEIDIKALKNLIEKTTDINVNPMIGKNDFMNFYFWFDETEESVTLPNHENYKRAEKLKEILFTLNKEKEEEIINMNDFINILTLKVMRMDNEKLKSKTYYQCLFF